MIRIAVFASGSGTNAEKVIQHFNNNQNAGVVLVLTNNSGAGVIERARRLNIPTKIFTKSELYDGSVRNILSENKIDFIVLAGFLLLIPENIINEFHKKIINIHPALLPAHGGKGFYGDNVHQAVISSGAIMSGITIHHVNDKFDDGEIIFQAACHIDKSETPESLAKKIHALEYSYFPVVIEKVIKTTSFIG